MRFVIKNFVRSTAIAAFAIMTSCGGEQIIDEPIETADLCVPGELPNTSISYAEGFKFSEQGGFRKITVFDPWNDGEIREEYLLIPHDCQAPENTDAIVVEIPVQTMVPFSTTHIGMIDELRVLDRIVAVPDGRWVYNEELRVLLDNSELPELGSMDNLDFEQMVMLEPQMAMVTGVEVMGATHEKMKKTGIPVVQNLEWKESHPLARAEWIKFIAAFLGEDEMAAAMFQEIEASYHDALEMAQEAESKPTIICSKMHEDTWFMPGGKSFMAQFLTDAGANYHWADDDQTGSMKLSPEVVIEHQLEADVWLNPEIGSRDELLALDGRYGNFKAYQEDKIFTNYNRYRESGGNDYWEQGTARPDLVLMDLVKILHPDLLPNHELFFYKKLD